MRFEDSFRDVGIVHKFYVAEKHVRFCGGKSDALVFLCSDFGFPKFW